MMSPMLAIWSMTLSWYWTARSWSQLQSITKAFLLADTSLSPSINSPITSGASGIRSSKHL